MKKFVWFIIIIALSINIYKIVVIEKNPDVVVFEPYEIQIGDTLWTIAKYACLALAERQHDTREVVFQITSRNNLGRYIYVGETIQIPIYIPANNLLEAKRRGE